MTRSNNLLGEFELSGIPPMPRGTPKIIVKLDIDVNGIMNVTANEESTGKSKNIVIKNDKNRHSKEDIDRMMKDAERWAEEDTKLRERIESRNNLESYLYSVRNSTNTEEFKSKLGEDNYKELTNLITDSIQWIESNQEATKEEYDAKQKEVETKVQPIMMKAYQQTSSNNANSTSYEPEPEHEYTGPKIDEVD